MDAVVGSGAGAGLSCGQEADGGVAGYDAADGHDRVEIDAAVVEGVEVEERVLRGVVAGVEDADDPRHPGDVALEEY